MSPDELRRLMHRFRVSSEKLGKAIGVHPVTVRRWRSGARHPGRGEVHRMMAFFRGLGGDPTPTIDPAEIVPAPIEHRITIDRREDPLPPANGATIVEAINGLVAILAAPRRRADPLLAPAPAETAEVAASTTWPQPLSLFRDDHGQSARPIARPPAARQPQIIDAMPLGPPPAPFTAPRGPRCRWPHTDAPGAPSGPCEQLASPGLPYCALHWVQHVQHRQR
jgi:hypothetical protein